MVRIPSQDQVKIGVKYMNSIFELIYKLENIHPDLYRNCNKQQFYEEAKKIKNLDKIDSKVKIAKLLAKLKDGHTSVLFDKQAIVELRYIDNNVYIIDDYKNIKSNYIYKKIVSINNIKIEEVIQKVEECFPKETENYQRFMLELYLLSKELLQGLGIIKDNIIIILEDGTKIDYNEELKKEYIKDIIYFENKVIEDNIYYIKYGVCNNMGDIDLDKWFESIIKDIKDNNYNKIIVDLRGNTGGNSKYFSDFYEKIKNENYSYICLVDRGVFSSGVYALNDMINLKSYIIGEPIGTTKNNFGWVTMIDFLNYDISCSNSEFLLANGKYIRYKKGDKIPSIIKEREPFKINKVIVENINDYIEHKDVYIDSAIEMFNKGVDPNERKQN